MKTHEHSPESALWSSIVLESAYYQAKEIEAEEKSAEDMLTKQKVILITDIGKAMKLLGYIMSVKQFDKFYDTNLHQLSMHLMGITDLVRRKFVTDDGC